MAANFGVLGLILSSSPYLRSTEARFPLVNFLKIIDSKLWHFFKFEGFGQVVKFPREFVQSGGVSM